MAYALGFPKDVTNAIMGMRDWRWEMVRDGGKTPSASCVNPCPPHATGEPITINMDTDKEYILTRCMPEFQLNQQWCVPEFELHPSIVIPVVLIRAHNKNDQKCDFRFWGPKNSQKSRNLKCDKNVTFWGSQLVVLSRRAPQRVVLSSVR